MTSELTREFTIVKQKGYPAYCVITDKGNSVVYPYVDRKTYLKNRYDVVYPLVEVFYHDNNCYHLWINKHGHTMCSLYETHEEHLEMKKWYEETYPDSEVNDVR